ncbi:MAG: hypothetical protein ABIP19_15265 [Dermatophilaceae bacterium]
MASVESGGDNLTDDDLQSEIELVGDLVVAATSSDGPLPQDEIDRLLGVHPQEDGPGSEEDRADPEPDR